MNSPLVKRPDTSVLFDSTYFSCFQAKTRDQGLGSREHSSALSKGLTLGLEPRARSLGIGLEVCRLFRLYRLL